MLDLKLIKYLQNNSFKKSSGFSIIELLLVFVLLITITTMFLQQINKKKAPTINDLAMQINEVTQKVFYTSISENKTYAMHLFFSENNLLTEIGYEEYNPKNFSNKIINKKKIANPFYIKSFLINGKDQMAIQSKQIWCLFFPNGYCQEITFSISKKNNEERHNFIINPFNGIIEDVL